MLPTLALVNFGPLLESFTVTIHKEGCTLSGPSGSGKSSIVDAYSLAHWGVNVDGSPVDTASVRGAAANFTLLADDLKLRIDAKKNGGWDRRIRVGDGDIREVKTAEAWRAELDALDPAARYGTRGETARRIMAPMGLIDLYLGESGPRKLRDAIVAALPPVDSTAVVAGLMKTAGYERLDTDPTDLADTKAGGVTVKGALALQTATNQAAAEAAAVARTKSAAAKDAAEKLAALKASAPTHEQIAEADTVTTLIDEWRAYDGVAETWQRADNARLAAAGRLTAWELRRDALGTAPVVDADDAATARGELTRAEQEHQRLTDAVRRAESEVAAEEQRAEAARVLALREQEEQERAIRVAAQAERDRLAAEARQQAALTRAAEEAEANRKREAEKARQEREDAVKAEGDRVRAELAAAAVVAAPVAPPAPVNPFPAPTAGALFASPPPSAPAFSADYRKGFCDARDAAASIVQWCRQNGETDHRSMLHPIERLTPENQNDKDED